MSESKLQRRWFCPRPNWVLFALLVIEGFLLLSEQLGWFGFHEDKVRTFATALNAAIVSMLLMLLWVVARWGFRRRFQFSIRSLLVLTVAVAIPCSWFAVNMQLAKRQRAAVTAIEALGGSAYAIASRRFGPGWLRNLLGDDFFDSVDMVNLSNSRFTNADLEKLRPLNHFTMLYLDGTDVTDDGLEHLKGLSQLRVLHLGKTKITDVGVNNLHHALPNCRIEH